MNPPTLLRIGLAGMALAGMALSLACGTTEPTPVSPVPSSGAWAPDLEQVTEGIVQELRGVGLDVVMEERIPTGPFSVGARRLDIPSVPEESIYIYVYASAAVAQDEASRLTPEGWIVPRPGEHPPPRATWWFQQYIYYRDRVIARYGGCTRFVRDAMTTLFGRPVVVAEGVIPCDLPS